MAGFDTKEMMNRAIRYMAEVATQRAAGGWVPPKERERQQREAMRQEQQQARQVEKQQKDMMRQEQQQARQAEREQQAQQKQFIADEKERQKNLAAFQKGNHLEVPHVVYHGSGNDLSSFDQNKAMSEGGAFYFSKDSHTKHGEGARNAGTYAPSRGGSIYPVHLSMKNPHIVGFTKPLPEDQEGVDKWVEEQEKFDRQFDDERFKTRYFREAIRNARQNGHDGVIIKNVTDDRHHNPIFSFPSDIFIAFEPTQIKSATGNSGHFDPSNPDITKSEGGQILSKQFPTQYMPNVGRQVMQDGGVPDQPQRQLSPMGFYSAAAERASALQPSGNAVQMVNSLRNLHGVKTEELQNAGLIDESNNVHPDWAGRGKVTRDELVSHLQRQMPQIEETVLGGNLRLGMQPTKYSEYALPGGENYREVLLKLPKQKSVSPEMQYKNGDDIRAKINDFSNAGFSPEAVQEAASFVDQFGSVEDGLRKQDALIARGWGYTPQQKEAGQVLRGILSGYQKQNIEAMRKAEQSNFKSPHWDDPNVLAHIRMSDRIVPPSPDKIIDIESRLARVTNAPPNTWGAGLADLAVKKGAISPEEAATYARQKGWRGSEYFDKEGLEQKILHVEELQSDWGQKGKKEGFAGQPREYKVGFLDDDGYKSYERFATKEEANNHYKKLQEQGKDSPFIEPVIVQGLGVPEAPYVTSTEGWTDLALKRVLKEAAEGGYHKVVWTPGEEQAERYDLKNHVSQIFYRPDKEYLTYADIDGGWIDHPNPVTPEKLPEVIGKDAAERLLSQTPDSNDGSYRLRGEDLHFGGEGMKGYYDNIVPKRLQAIAKKHDKNAKVGYTDIMLPAAKRKGSNNPPIQAPGIDITPEMRESILRGQSAYKRGGTVSKKHPALSIAGTHIREETHGEPIFTGRL